MITALPQQSKGEMKKKMISAFPQKLKGKNDQSRWELVLAHDRSYNIILNIYQEYDFDAQ